MLYRGLGKEALDAAYNNTNAVGIEQRNAYISDWEMRSEIVNNIWRPRCNIPYGSRPRQRLDVFSCGTAEALYAFKSRGFGGEVGLDINLVCSWI